MTERRFLHEELELETREDGPSVLRGYAAVYYRSDDPGTEFELFDNAVERIMPGAFERALSEGDDTRGLFNHDPSMVLGRSGTTMRLTTNTRGLQYEIDLPDTTVGRDVAESIRRRDVTGSSFAFQVEDESWRSVDGRDVREVRSVRLFDVGPVTFPAYKATTTGVRSECPEARSSYDTWKAEQGEAELRRRIEMEQQQARVRIALL